MALPMRHRRSTKARAQSERFTIPAAAGPTLVTVSPRRAADVLALESLLGTDYEVRVGLPGEGDVSVLTATTPESVAFLNARYPDTALLVFEPLDRPDQTDRTVALLNAGADDVVAGATLPVLAAHVITVARRVGLGPNVLHQAG